MRKIADDLNFLRKRGDTVAINPVSEKVQLGDAKEAPVRIDNNTVRGETLKYSSQVLEMLLWVTAGNKNVNDIGVDHGNSAEDLVHEALESLSYVA